MTLVNQVFGKLTVKGIIDAFACECSCSCGKTVRVATKSLLDGSVTKCHSHRTPAKKHWYKGKGYTTAQITEKFQVSRQTFMLRIHRGWSVAKAIETKVGKDTPNTTRRAEPLQTWEYPPGSGVQRTIHELAALADPSLGLTRPGIRGRLRTGWTVTEAITLPKQTPRPGRTSVYGRALTRGQQYEYPAGSGELYCLRQLAKLAKLSINAVKTRLSNGWDITRVVETPAFRAPRTAEVKLYEYRGQRYTIPALIKLSGINGSTLRNRLRNGWSVTDAVETPVLTPHK